MLVSDFQFPLYSGKEINSPPKEEDKTTYKCWKDLHFNPALEQAIPLDAVVHWFPVPRPRLSVERRSVHAQGTLLCILSQIGPVRRLAVWKESGGGDVGGYGGGTALAGVCKGIYILG